MAKKFEASPAAIMAAKKPPRKRGSIRNHPHTCLLWKKRAELRLSLRDVSEGTGVSVSGLFEIEQGSDVQLSTMRKLCTFFSCRVDDLWPT